MPQFTLDALTQHFDAGFPGIAFTLRVAAPNGPRMTKNWPGPELDRAPTATELAAFRAIEAAGGSVTVEADSISEALLLATEEVSR